MNDKNIEGKNIELRKFHKSEEENEWTKESIITGAGKMVDVCLKSQGREGERERGGEKKSIRLAWHINLARSWIKSRK